MIVSFRQTDEVPLSLLVDDDSSDWWGGAQRCFSVAVASTALAASLLTAGISRNVPVDEQTPTLSAPVTPVDEDYWIAPPPVQAVLWQKLPLGDPEEIPGTLSGQPDEDYWTNPTAPVPASVFQRLPYLMDAQDDPAGVLRGQPDEDYWLLGPPSSPSSIYQRFPHLFDPEEIPAGSLFGQDDEDFWTNSVAPVQAVLYQRLPLGDPEELPAGSLSGQDDEDLWQNRVAPVPAVLYQRLPYLPDPEELNAGTLFGPVEDEDFWVSGVAPVVASLYQRLPIGDPEELPSGSFYGEPDEDFLKPSASIVAQAYPQPFAFDPAENNLPASGQIADEDYWVTPPPAQVVQVPRVFTDDDVIAGACQTILSVPGTFTINDSNQVVTFAIPAGVYLNAQWESVGVWSGPILPNPLNVTTTSGTVTLASRSANGTFDDIVLASAAQLADINAAAGGNLSVTIGISVKADAVSSFTLTICASGTPLPPEKGYLETLATPVAATMYVALPLQPDTEEPAIPASTQDDDYWQVGIPVPVVQYQKLPLGDGEETPLLTGNRDEDYWQNPVSPVPASVYQRLPIGDPEEINAGSLFGPIEDEDYWNSGVAPVQSTLYQRLPYLPDTEETAGNLKGQPDEDYWTLGPVSVPASLYQRLPVLFDPEELNAGSLFGPVEDEDYWTSGVAPVQSVFYQPLPYLPDANESSAGALFGVPETEQWVVLPIQPTALIPRVFTDEDILPLIYVLDDDAGRIWVPCAIQPQVQAFSVEDTISALGVDEDYWQRYTSNGQTFLIPVFGFSDEVKGFVLQPDEDFWILRVKSTGYAPFRHVAFAPDWDTIGGLFIPASGTIVKGSALSKVSGRAIQIVRADADQRIKGK